MATHQQFMRRCLQLASKALGNTYPNPMVGCVIVCNNQIIGEGYTSPAGQNHAEVNAINAVKNKALLKKSTLYVSLEPCSHQGKTPPCSHAIAKHQIPKVVVGCLDQNPTVHGNGIKYLQQHGVDVLVGILEDECIQTNQRFFNLQQHQTPYVILKWAQTANGFFAPKQAQQQWITNAYTKQLTHLWRSQEHAILVGKNTAKIDNPSLTARLWKSNNQPIKVLIDKNLEIPKTYNIYQNTTPIIVFNQNKNKQENNIQYIAINFQQPLPNQILTHLGKMQINSLMVEGGANTLQQFIMANAWNQARILTSNTHWEEGILAPTINQPTSQQQIITNNQISIVYNH